MSTPPSTRATSATPASRSRSSPAPGTNRNLKALSSGTVQYASIDLTGAFLEYGRPGGINDFTIVGAVQQRSLTALMALEESGISTPRDLENKTIGAQPGSVNQVLFPTYARLAGIDATKVKFQNVAPQQQPQLLASKQVDVITQFPVGKPGVERAAGGKKAVVLPYTDVITDLFGGAIGVSKKTAQEKPDQVKRFMTALLKGLSDTINNPQEAGQIYAKFEKTQPAPVAAAEMTLMRPYVDLGSGLGQIDQSRAARSIAILQGAGAIPDGLKPEDVISFDLIPEAGRLIPDRGHRGASMTPSTCPISNARRPTSRGRRRSSSGRVLAVDPAGGRHGGRRRALVARGGRLRHPALPGADTARGGSGCSPTCPATCSPRRR